MATEDFFAAVLPSAGLRCIAIKVPDRKGMQQFFSTGNDAATRTALGCDARANVQVYFGCASFQNAERQSAERDGRREGDNVAWVKSFWLDVDAGEGKPYTDAREAARAVEAFSVARGLAPPMLVLSGCGVHAYWPMIEDMTPAQWRLAATALKAATKLDGLLADPSRTADIASVLRPAGTYHKKGAPKLVRVIRGPSPMAYDDFLACFADLGIEEAHRDALGAAPTHVGALGPNDDLKGGLGFAPAFADRIADKCGVVDLVRQPPTKLDQTTWYHVIQVLAKCEDGQVKAHEWSARDPRYTELETQSAFDRAGAFGPTLCERFSELQPAICDACPHSGMIRSPIVLGQDTLTAATVVEANSVAAVVPSLPKIIGEPNAMGILNGYLGYSHNWGGSPTPVIFGPDGAARRVTVAALRESASNVFVVRGDDQKLVPAIPYWMANKHRSEFARTVFDPEGIMSHRGERVLNLYRGLARQPAQGCWQLMMEHLLEVICRSDRRAFRYLIRWLAHAVQRPGTAPGTVIVLRSRKEGTGKTTVGEWIQTIFGPHGLMLNTPEQLVSRFNAHLEGVCFICLNEPAFPGNQAEGRKFKSMVTDASWLIEPKGHEIYSIPNIAHIMLTTNEQWAVPAGNGARRWVMLDVDDRRAGDTTYFNRLYGEANNGGIEAMLYDLMNLDLGKFDIRDIPHTAALAEQQALSAPVEVQWALDAAEGGDGEVQFGANVATAALHRSYTKYASDQGVRRPMQRLLFGRWLGSLGLQAAQIGPARLKGWSLPTADQFRDLVEKSAGFHTPGERQ